MSQPLIPCPSCDRHVLADASACPFCTARLEARERPPRATASPGPRLGRAALLAAGAALVGAAACDSSIAPPYGIPPDGASYDAPAGTGGRAGGEGAGGHGGGGGAPPSADAGTGRLVVPLQDAATPVPRKAGP